MKQLIRKKYIEIRKSMNEEEVVYLSSKIIDNIKNQFDLDKYKCIGLYMPISNEVDLRPFIDELLSLNKTVVLPKVENKFDMDFYAIKSLNDVYLGNFKVLEPNNNEKMPKNEIDIIFIPGIAFSNNKYRLGYGAGYYDRYLKDYQNITVGVCFEFQLIIEIPYDKYDIPMKYIITENPLHLHHD